MEARRCNIHGLVAAEDGRCVVCRRGDTPLEDQEPPVVSPTTLIFAGGGILIGGLLVYGLVREAARHEKPPPPPAPIVASDDRAPLPAPQYDDPQANSPTPKPSPLPEPSPQPTSGAQMTTFDERGARSVEEDPKLTAAKHQVSIKMYVTPWCDYCKLARQWLSRQGYRFTEYDVQQSETDKVELKSLNPEMTTPTFNIGGLPLVGFDPQSIDDTITRVASARLKRR